MEIWAAMTFKNFAPIYISIEQNCNKSLENQNKS